MKIISAKASLFLISTLLFSSAAFSARIADIRVEGLQRVSAGTVFTILPVQVGDEYDKGTLREISHELFQTGYFSDVRVGLDENVLILNFVERPAIDKIDIDGNKAISTEDLKRGLVDNGLGEGQIFKRSTLDGLTQELRRQYVAQGRYSAVVKAETTELPGNRVKISINIDEGSVAAIKHINIVGNSVFSDKELRDLFTLHSTGMWSWISGDDKYAKEKLNGDIETLKSHYLDRGYLNFTVDSTQVSISPDKESVYITINITEGDVYTVSETTLAGNLVVPEEKVNALILLKPKQTFSQLLMTTSSDYITQLLGNAGYTFAEVRGIPELNEEDKTVKVTFFMDPGKRVYVRRIEFRGNTKTQDEVLRREMRQMEAASASSAKIEQSRLRLDRLGFFKEAKVENVEVPGVEDQIDVIYTVEEAPSGSVGASVGYQQGYGLVLGANVSQANFMGTGNQVSFGVNTSTFETTYSFSYTDPYYTKDGVSRGISLYYQARDFDKVNLATFSTDSRGINISYGYPLSEIERVGFSYGYRALDLKTGRSAVQEISGTPEGTIDDLLTNPGNRSTYISEEEFLGGCASSASCTQGDIATDLDESNLVFNPVGFEEIYGSRYEMLPLNFNWAQSTLNRGRLATRGHSQRLGLEITVPGSDLEYYKMTYNAQYFQPLTNSLTLRLRTDLGYGDGYGDTLGLPFFQNFYAGGFGSVRGFKRNTLGPQSTPAASYSLVDNGDGTFSHVQCGLAGEVSGEVITDESRFCFNHEVGQLATGSVATTRNNAFGGNILVEFGAEILFPLPFGDQRQMQSSFFIDAGNVFSTSCPDYSQYTHLSRAQVSDLSSRCSDVDFNKLRASAGLGLTWISPMGPLTFSIAKPLREEAGDRKEFFQFSLGTTY